MEMASSVVFDMIKGKNGVLKFWDLRSSMVMPLLEEDKEEVDEPEVEVYQCVDQVEDFEPQTLHRDDVDPTVVCDDVDLIEIVLDFDEQVEDKLEDDENEGDEEDREVEEDNGDEVEDDDEDEEDY
ncbi:unnamed protein product [Citrullus colocynthis]|uniref:Uncharacterized protein n=1 Tax=Citrullus colocynthis TaxID=252529 RepID=A0ABP0ZBL2_9ROSI